MGLFDCGKLSAIVSRHRTQGEGKGKSGDSRETPKKASGAKPVAYSARNGKPQNGTVTVFESQMQESSQQGFQIPLTIGGA